MLPRLLWSVVLPLLEDLSTPRSLTVKLLIEHGEFAQLANLATVPAHYVDSDKYFRDCVATSLLRKCKDLETGIDTQAKARETFYAAEKQCKLANDRLDPYLHNSPGPLGAEGWRIRDFLGRVKNRVARVLGPLPRDLHAARHGPGATYSDRGRFVTIPDKMSSQPSVTSEARALLPFWEETYWFRALAQELPHRSEPLTVRGNRFTTVDKDATTDRGIAIEPSLNVYFQLGVGQVLRSRLKESGIDLKEGQDLHRLLAREASRNTKGHLATIDLSSASDTVCRNLVKILLPDSWYCVLDTLRSPTTSVDGKVHHLQKFSSMGNGFTFELESLIFSQVCAQVLEDVGIDAFPGVNFHVYGDDIIVPSEGAAVCLSALKYLGFTPNPKKCFSSGPFRESCGGDYFNGVPVRGHFLKSFPVEPSDWISLANGLRRVAFSNGGDAVFSVYFRRAWFRVLDNIPSMIRGLRGPVELGDVVIHDIPETWRPKWKHGIRYIKSWQPITKPIPLSRWKPLVQLASALYGVPSRGPVPRGRVEGYRGRWIAFS